jgi:hypothetical protein
MDRSELAALDPGLTENEIPDARRKVWVVTVQDDITVPAGPSRASRVAHVYTEVIDAESGFVTDMCFGCAPLP